MKNKYDVNLEEKELFSKDNHYNKNKKWVNLFKIIKNKKTKL